MSNRKKPPVIIKKNAAVSMHHVPPRYLVQKETLMDKMERFSQLPLTTQILIVGGTLGFLGLAGYIAYLFLHGGEEDEEIYKPF